MAESARRPDHPVAFVTGAGSGLGREIAVRLAADGAAVACVDRQLESTMETARLIRLAGGLALAIQADVLVPESLDHAARRTVDEFGGLTVAVANAGVALRGTALETTPPDWAHVIATNLTGVWHTARAVLPAMIAAGRGCVINQASVAGLIGVPGLAAYSAAKGGVIALTRQMAIDYAPYNVRVNAIAPATVDTPLVDAALAGGTADQAAREADRDRKRARHPLGRLGTPADVAGAAAFLAGGDATWITGTILTVDGGRTAA